MDRILPFGAMLTEILRARGISATAFARTMDMKSKTALLRILKDQSMFGTIEKFHADMEMRPPECLAEEDMRALRHALNVSRVGVETYRNNLAMWEMLRPAPAPDGDFRISGLDYASTLAELLEKYAAERDVDIIITGLCDRAIIRLLGNLLCGAKASDARVRHFFFSDEQSSDVIRKISAIRPVIFSPKYMPYAASSVGHRSLQGEIMLCTFRDVQGKRHWQQLVRTGECDFQGIEYDGPDSYRFWADIFGGLESELPTLKQTFESKDTASDYLSFTANCLQMEQNRTICMLKPDIPLNFVSPDILKNVALESFAQMGFSAEADTESLVQDLWQIHSRRFNSVFRKKKPTIAVFSRQDMLAFAQTGRQSDHFYAMRPYTPEERVMILTHCLQQSRENPCFSMYFTRSGEWRLDSEMTYYDGIGTMILNAHTSYDFNNDHEEVLIGQNAFSQHFYTFFHTELLASHVLPQEEGHAFMERLIDQVRRGG